MEKLYRLTDLPIQAPSFVGIAHARGHIDGLIPQQDRSLLVHGWMLLIDDPLDQVEVYVDGERRSMMPLEARPDVAAAFPWIPHALTSGLLFRLPTTGGDLQRTSRIDLVGCQNGQRRALLRQFVRSDLDRLPSPPEALMYRVAHIRDAHTFKVYGLKTFGEFLEAAGRHADIGRFRRVLDWGCGCGRVTAYFLSALDGPEVVGCDIDPAAIAWCDAFLRAGAFTVLNAMPPAPYPDEAFDLIYSYSVFTHLTRSSQHAWLSEMTRLLAPGGIFVATTHGESAFRFKMASPVAELPPEGIVDSLRDPTLDGIAPKGYYRATYQSEAYTRREFGRYLDVLEYTERGAQNFQDLVVMQKR